MRFITKLCLFLLWTSTSFSENVFPEDKCIEKIIFISDVDGVVRDSIDAIADPRVIAAIRSLLHHTNIDVTFISGTPIINDPTLEPWRRGNVSLSRVFGSSFEKEISEGRVSIFGALGGHRMHKDGGIEVVDGYPIEVSFELSSLLLKGFLQEVYQFGTEEQKNLAGKLLQELSFVTLQNKNQTCTAEEFTDIICKIRKELDPEFRLINSGALVETHTSNPPWNTSFSSKWLLKEMDSPQYLLSSFPQSQKKLATGFAKKDEQGFNYLLVSKTNKGFAIQKHIEEKLKAYPDAFIITIGDTQVDFPMHEHAHLAFHVGAAQVWQNNPIAHCVLICDEEGKDRQQVEGNLKVLELLKEIKDKTFQEVKEMIGQDPCVERK